MSRNTITQLNGKTIHKSRLIAKMGEGKERIIHQCRLRMMQKISCCYKQGKEHMQDAAMPFFLKYA